MKRTCTNVGCSMYDRAVETDKADCMACGRKMRTNSDIVGDILGDGFAKEFFGLGGKPLPSDVSKALREASTALDRLAEGGKKTTRGELRRLRAQIEKVLSDYA